MIAARDGGIVFANRRAEELTGYAAGELTGRPVDVLPPRGSAARPVDDRFETLCRRADGDPLPVEVLPRVDRGARDVPGRHAPRPDRAQGGPRGAVRGRSEVPRPRRRDPRGRVPGSRRREPGIIYVSPQITDLIGITRTEWLTDPYCWRTTSTPTTSTACGRSTRTPTTTTSPLNHEYRMVHEDGTVKWVLEQAFPIDDEQGEPVADPGRDLRHHRAKAGRGAGRVPRLPRQAHRPAEPRAVRGDARERDRPGPPARPRRRRPLPRPRQLQARERLARPPGRRPAARASSATASADCTRETDLVAAPGRRRVPAAAV